MGALPKQASSPVATARHNASATPAGRGTQTPSGKSTGQPFAGAGFSAGLRDRENIKIHRQASAAGYILLFAWQSAAMSHNAATGTASRRLGPGDDAGRGLPERVDSAEGGVVEEQNVLTGMGYTAIGDDEGRGLEQDLGAGDTFDKFSGGMLHLDTMPCEIRLAIFKHLEAADLCRLGCTSKSVESWLRIQTATWVQCLSTSDSAFYSPSSSQNMLHIRHPQAFWFPLNRLGSLGMAVAPYAQVIAAYADVPKYGEKVGAHTFWTCLCLYHSYCTVLDIASILMIHEYIRDYYGRLILTSMTHPGLAHPMRVMAMQVAQAAVRTLGKLGAAALPHVHRILMCATDKVYRDKMTFSVYLHGRGGGLWSYAGALIDLLPYLTSSTQRLQEVVTHLEEGYDRPDILLCVLAHAGEAALPYKLKTLNILSSYLKSLTETYYYGNVYYGNRRPGLLSDMFDNSRKSIKNMLAALPRQFIHSAEVQEMMQRGLGTRLEGIKAKLRAKTGRMKAELGARMEEITRVGGMAEVVQAFIFPAERLKAELERTMERWKAETECTKERTKAEVEDRMGIMQVAKLEDRLERMNADLEAMMDGVKADLAARMEGMDAALMAARYSAAAVTAVRSQSACIASWHQVSAVLGIVVLIREGLIRIKKTRWSRLLAALGSRIAAPFRLNRRLMEGRQHHQ